MINRESLRKIFKYSDGKLIRIKKTSNNCKLGECNKQSSTGYLVVNFNKKRYKVHRLIYLMHHGYVPKYIDHIDGNKTNNKIENLRECTISQNTRNGKIRTDNKSGVKGVSWDKANTKWRVSIRAENRSINLGRYTSLELAELVANEARFHYHGEFARDK